MRRWLPFLAVAVLAAGCGRSPSPLARFQRLELRAAAERKPSATEPRVLRLDVPGDLQAWRAVGEHLDVQEGPDGVRTLWIQDGAQLRIPGPFDPSLAQAVVVRARLDGRHHFNVRLEPAHEASSYSIGAPDELQELRFEYRGIRRLDQPIEQITLSVRGPRLGLESVELLEVPLEQHLPAPDQPRLVDLDGDARRGVGLSRGLALEAGFDVRAGDVLRYSVGRPYEVASGDDGPSRVRVTLQDGTRLLERLTELTAREDGSVPWQEERVGLEPLAGRSVRVRFELEAPADAPLVAALADVFVEGRGGRAPTVLLITSDTHRGDHLGSAGVEADLRTPSLDALARRGTAFEDCWSTSSITSPSHVAIMTGLHPRDTGLVRNDHVRLSESARTLAESFAAEGFATYAVVTFYQLGPNGAGLGQGFDRLRWSGGSLFDGNLPGGTWDAEQPVSLLESLLPEADGRPLFAWLHIADAHWPYAPPGEFDRMYYPAAKDPLDPSLPPLRLPPGSRIFPALRDLRDLEYPRAQYRAEVTYLDRELGRLLRHPRLRDAVVAFTSDHGELMRGTGTLFTHSEIRPATLHVPLILAGPGVPAGARVGRSVVQTDVARTLLDLAGLAGAPFPGRNLLEWTARAGGQDEPRFAIGPFGDTASITLGPWFLVLTLTDRPSSRQQGPRRHELSLFDLRVDPDCLVDVAGQERDTARRLREGLVRWLASPEGEDLSDALQQDEEALAHLAALGYSSDLATTELRAWIDPDCGCERCRAWR